jgi:hypothetical protein
MARQDSTGRSGTGGDRWHGLSDPRSRFRVVGSGSGDRGRESSHRSLRPAVHREPGKAGGKPDLALVGKLPIPAAEQTLQATPVLSNCPDCSAPLSVLRIILGRAGAEYWTMRCTRCGGIHLNIVKAASARKDTGDLLV